MSQSAYTKTASELFASANVAAYATAISSVLTCTTALWASLFIDFGPRGTGAPTVGTRFLVQGRRKDSGDTDAWRDIQVAGPTSTSSPLNPSVVGTVTAGATTLQCDSVTGLKAGDVIFFNAGSSSEWARIALVSVSTDFISLVDPLAFTQTGNDFLTEAAHYVVSLDLAPYKAIRVVILNAPDLDTDTANNIRVRITAILTDTIGS